MVQSVVNALNRKVSEKVVRVLSLRQIKVVNGSSDGCVLLYPQSIPAYMVYIYNFKGLQFDMYCL